MTPEGLRIALSSFLMKHICPSACYGLLGLWLLCTTSSLATAGLIIDVRGAEISIGQPGFVDVYIGSDVLQNVDLFQYKFMITPSPQAVGILRFLENQSDAVLGIDNYIHFGDSAFLVSQGQNTPVLDEILGSGATETGTGTNIQGPVLLARLEIEYALPEGTPESAGMADTFMITLVNDLDTFFYDSEMNIIQDYSGTPGTVRLAIIATPEPASLFFVAFGAGCALHLGKRFRRSIPPIRSKAKH